MFDKGVECDHALEDEEYIYKERHIVMIVIERLRKPRPSSGINKHNLF
jgi:hypothetical protein